MTTFEDKLFALIHGLPLPNEPKNVLADGPSEPGAFQKAHEKLVFDHLLGKRSEPVEYEIPVLSKLLAPRDSREFGEPITPRCAPEPFEPLAKHAPLKHASGAVRFEEKIVGEDRWRYGYDSKGELVSAYLLPKEL